MSSCTTSRLFRPSGSAWTTRVRKPMATATNQAGDVFVRDRSLESCTVPAWWTTYGSGWPGTNGVPSLSATSNPVLCTTLGIAADNSSGVTTAGELFAGFQSAQLATEWGGTLLLLPALSAPVTIPAMGLSLSALIPCDNNLCGVEFSLQVLQFDAGASRGVSFTPGLELRLGVQ